MSKELLTSNPVSPEYRELLLGCGRSRDRRIPTPNNATREWANLTTLDSNAACEPDMVWDLNNTAIPFDSDTFAEIHAYEVLEHLSYQGDAVGFFRLFFELWRILMPGGYLAGSCPSRFSPWLWGDPGHTRAITPESLTFLSQPAYAECDQKIPGPRTDYRDLWHGDFEVYSSKDDREHHTFILQAIKPARSTR